MLILIVTTSLFHSKENVVAFLPCGHVRASAFVDNESGEVKGRL